MKLSTLLTALLLLPLAAQAQTGVVDEVIWMIGDDPILRSDVEEARISAEMYGEHIDNPYCVIPEQIAVQKLFLHQAAIDSIEVDETEIRSRVEEMIGGYIQNFGSRENVEMMARKSIAQFREQLRTRERNRQLVQRMQQKLTAGIKVTPAEVREYFRQLPADSLPMVPTQVEVQIITSQPQVSRAEVERIEGRLREFARRVNSGETEFATLAKFYSQDGSARNGGEMDYAGRNQWVPEFANVAFSLNDPKKVSKIVRTEYGFHIIQLIDKRGDKVKVRHILLKPEIEESEYAQRTAHLDSIAGDIRAGKFTFDEAAAALSDDKDTRLNHGLMANVDQNTGMYTSRFQMKELPADIARHVETMQPGDVTPAFRYTNQKGQTVCAIVRLKNRIEAHRADATEDYQRLKDIVLEERNEKKLDSWIREKQRTTYVRISPEWRSCDFKYPGWLTQATAAEPHDAAAGEQK